MVNIVYLRSITWGKYRVCTTRCPIFKISRNTINLWLKKREKTGEDYRGEVGYQQGYNPKITDLEKFRQFAEANGSLTQKEMAEKWSEPISDRSHFR